MEVKRDFCKYKCELRTVTFTVVLQIIFYEDKNFQGRSYECCSDNPDLHSYFSRCNSVRVENGNWILYERTNYTGHQYFLRRGEYPDLQKWKGFNGFIRSCRLTPQHQGPFRMKIYEREDFRGQMMEFTEDCSNVYEQFRYHDIHSCHILDGYWMFYEEPDYKGHQYYLKHGEYRRYSDWGAKDARVGSFKQIQYLQ
ncbi:gamma-crystallin 1-like [Spea bombifrons]|uniref:gamma-crystallin 1-like n=1 Tax=Spea bombifrons TaxID=233779 RepID=UPI00234A5AA0|nr:gamma-crystallin 1-like [Spea bombifrons]